MAIHRRLRLEMLERRQLLAGDLENYLTTSEALTAESQTKVPDGLRAAEVRIQFDPEKVSPQPTDFLPGPAWQGKGAIVTNVDAAEGTVTAFLFSIDPIQSTDGDLIDIRLPVGPVEPDESIPAFAIESIKVDEGQQQIDPQEHRIDPVVSEEIKRQVQSRAELTAEQRATETFAFDANASDSVHSAEPLALNEASEPSVAIFSDNSNPSATFSPSTPTDDSTPLSPDVVDEVYGPIIPWNFIEESANVLRDIEVANLPGPTIEPIERPAISDACSWQDYLSINDSARAPSRAALLDGARDDWSELDRLGYRKA